TQSLAAAFASERHRRELPDTPRLLAPDANVWRTGYARIARDLPELTESTLDQALKLTHVFIDPVLSGERACDVWNPDTLTWQPSTPPNAAP
ncbi:MAG: hypothetical protein ACRDQA_28780, partial [Nocardioidaceae bacterium]